MRSGSRGPMRFSPSPWQLMTLDALAGAGGVTLALLLRFLDEGSVPATYAQRLVPWLVLLVVRARPGCVFLWRGACHSRRP